MWLSNDLLKYSPEHIGFLIKLAALRWKDTDSIHMSNNEIIKAMNIGKSTFYRHIGKLLEDGMVTKIEDGYSLNKDIFLVPDYSEKVEKCKRILDDIADSNPDFKNGKRYRAFYEHYNTDFENLGGTIG